MIKTLIPLPGLRARRVPTTPGNKNWLPIYEPPFVHKQVARAGPSGLKAGAPFGSGADARATTTSTRTMHTSLICLLGLESRRATAQQLEVYPDKCPYVNFLAIRTVMRKLTPAEVLKEIPGLDSETLRAWTRTGLVQAEIQPSGKTKRRYLESQLPLIRRMHELHSQGLAPRHALAKAQAEVDVQRATHTSSRESNKTYSLTFEKLLHLVNEVLQERNVEPISEDDLEAIISERF